MLFTQIFMFENRSQKRNAYSKLFSGRHIRNSRLRGGGRVGVRVPKYFGLKVFFLGRPWASLFDCDILCHG